MDLRGNLSSGKHLCNFSVPGCVIQKMRSNNMSVQPPGIKMTDSVGRQSCDYTDLSLESALICSSAPGICLRSWHLDLDSSMGLWWVKATRNVQRGKGSLA